MHDALQKEIATYEKRTPKSAAAHKRALQRIPLGVASNYRHYEPYPIFVKDGKAGRIHDVDGNEYVDHNLCFGALMAGHCHPAVVKAVKEQLDLGTTFGMPHDQEWELAEEICKRYPVEMVRFGSSGTEVTMHACRIARAATGRDKIIKFEGAYHGLHDTALVSVKPKEGEYGDEDAPNSIPGGGGVPKSAVDNVVVASFNNLKSVENRFKQFPGQIAAIIMEPILMNVGLCLPEPGFLEGLRKLCDANGALLIFDEVKTGANGALMLYSQEIKNYRDWTKIDVDLWRHYWFAMVNRGVLAQPYWWDEQWTISVQHTEADIDKHLAVFEEVAPALSKAQQERGLAFVGAAGH